MTSPKPKVWTRSKTGTLRGISNANAVQRQYTVSDFNRQDIMWFAEEGWVTMGVLGPYLTAQGERKLRAVDFALGTHK